MTRIREIPATSFWQGRCVFVAIAAMALAACATPEPPRISRSAPATPDVFRTLDGQVFATEAARSAYLRAAYAARTRGDLELELARIRINAGSLSAQQATRRSVRITGQNRRIAKATAEARTAARDLAQVQRQQRQLRREDGAGLRLLDNEARRAEMAARRAASDLRAAPARAGRAQRERGRLRRTDRRSRAIGGRRSRISTYIPE